MSRISFSFYGRASSSKNTDRDRFSPQHTRKPRAGLTLAIPRPEHRSPLFRLMQVTWDGGNTNRRYPTARGERSPHTASSGQVWKSPDASYRDDHRAGNATAL